MLIWGWVAGWLCGMLCYKAVREMALRWIKKAEAQAEARVQRATRGAPEWPEDAEDVDVAVVSGLVRLHGFHVFDVMVG